VEQVRGQRHVGCLRHTERLAVVQGLQLGELIQVLQNHVADPPDDPTALGGGHPAPRTIIEGPAGRPHRPVDVLGIALGNPGEGLAGRGVGGLERPARGRIDKPPVDEHLSRGAGELLDLPVQGHCHAERGPWDAPRFR
jgi:hypothetical protein